MSARYLPHSSGVFSSIENAGRGAVVATTIATTAAAKILVIMAGPPCSYILCSDAFGQACQKSHKLLENRPRLSKAGYHGACAVKSRAISPKKRAAINQRGVFGVVS